MNNRVCFGPSLTYSEMINQSYSVSESDIEIVEAISKQEGAEVKCFYYGPSVEEFYYPEPTTLYLVGHPLNSSCVWVLLLEFVRTRSLI
jgi:hypothetical protein